jgi:hypothetical protein
VSANRQRTPQAKKKKKAYSTSKEEEEEEEEEDCRQRNQFIEIIDFVRQNLQIKQHTTYYAVQEERIKRTSLAKQVPIKQLEEDPIQSSALS